MLHRVAEPYRGRRDQSDVAARALFYFETLTQSRLYWLIRVRWLLLLATALVVVAVPKNAFPGVRWPLLYVVLGATALYNLWFWHAQRYRRRQSSTALGISQAFADLVALTAVLWAAGGIHCPFVVYYALHIALMAVVGSPRAITCTAGGTAIAVLGLSALEFFPSLHGGFWDPKPAWDLGARVLAYVSTLTAVAYLVGHAVRELRAGERAVSLARDRAALDDQMLSSSLRALRAGLEVVDENGRIHWRNSLAEVLAPYAPASRLNSCSTHALGCEAEATGRCSLAAQGPGDWAPMQRRCRFAARIEGQERVFEMTLLPLASRETESPRWMAVYLDQTESMLTEHRLVLAERLASFGRVAQGVAHEINTPLASIQTLAADMVEALKTEIACVTEAGPAATQAADPHHDGSAARLLVDAPSAGRDDVLNDVSESAALIQDEARRLGRITHALLAGGDLTRAHVVGAVPLFAVVERACALVFAGERDVPTPHLAPCLRKVTLAADPDRLMQVLVNLLQNALDAVRSLGAERSGRIEVSGMHGADRFLLLVSDNGEGLKEEVRDRLFEPFATTKPPGKGTGLGLYTSYMLVEGMGGRLDLRAREGGGAVARLELPLAQSGRQELGATGASVHSGGMDS